MTRTERKLLEAKFFLRHMREHWRHVPHVDFYLSAFISSARSVTWVMKSEFGDVAGWEAWYKLKSPGAEGRDFLRKLNEIRVRSEKTHPVDTTLTATMHIPPEQVTPEVKAWLSGSRSGTFKLIPVDNRNLEFDITDGRRVIARGVLHSAQHELPEFPGEDALSVGQRYVALLEPLVAECVAEFSNKTMEPTR